MAWHADMHGVGGGKNCTTDGGGRLQASGTFRLRGPTGRAETGGWGGTHSWGAHSTGGGSATSFGSIAAATASSQFQPQFQLNAGWLQPSKSNLAEATAVAASTNMIERCRQVQMMR